MTPIAKLYALLESNGIYDEAISLLKEHSRSRVMENDSQYDRQSKPYVMIEIPVKGQDEPKRIAVTAKDLPVDSPRGIGSPLMKLKLVALVSAGLFSYEEAKKRYDMDHDELSTLVSRYREFGREGLKSMRTGERETSKLQAQKLKTRD